MLEAERLSILSIALNFSMGQEGEALKGVQGERLPLWNFVAVGDKITTELLFLSAIT